MELDEMKNAAFIAAHLATPLALAYTVTTENKEPITGLQYLLNYIKYGGMPHNLVTTSHEHKELMHLLAFYAQIGPSNLAASPYYEDKAILAVLRAIYKILDGAQSGEITSDFLQYYVEAKHQIQFEREH